MLIWRGVTTGDCVRAGTLFGSLSIAFLPDDVETVRRVCAQAPINKQPMQAA
jgi:hypothetical protein